MERGATNGLAPDTSRLIDSPLGCESPRFFPVRGYSWGTRL